MELGGVYHEWNLAHIRLRDKQVHKLCHGRHTINQTVIHVDVKHISTLLNLLKRNGKSLLIVAINNRLLVHHGTSNIASLTNIQESAPHVLLIRSVVQRFKATQAHLVLNHWHLPWLKVFHKVGNSCDVIVPSAAATAKHVHKALLHKRTNLLLHLSTSLIVPSHAVGQTSIGISKDVAVATVAQVLYVLNHVAGTKSAVQSKGHGLHMLHTVPKGLVGLTTQRTAAVVNNGATDEHREADAFLGKVLLNGIQSSLCIQRVKDGLNKQHINTASEQRINLNSVSSNNLVKGHVTERRVLNGWRNTQSPVRWTNSAANKSRLGRILGRELDTALLGKLRSSLVYQVHLLLGLQLVVCLGNGGAAESICLNEVRANLKELAVNLTDDVRTRDHKNIIVPLQWVAMVLVPLTLEVRLIKLVLLNRGSHGTINHQNALSEELVNHTIVGRGLDGGFEWLVHGDGTQVLRRQELLWDPVNQFRSLL